jgi:hypothetical protein
MAAQDEKAHGSRAFVLLVNRRHVTAVGGRQRRHYEPCDVGLRIVLARRMFWTSAHDLIRADPVGGEQDDFGSPSLLLSGVAVPEASSRRRSAGETVMDIPVRMRQTRMCSGN